MSNYVGHTDGGVYSTPRKKHRKIPNHIYHDDEGYFNTRVSSNAPSIVGLENLHVDGSEERYTVHGREVNHRPPNTRGPIQAFQPEVPPVPQQRRGRTRVEVNIVFMKVGQVETIREYFEADVFIQAKWREPLLDHAKVHADVCFIKGVTGCMSMIR